MCCGASRGTQPSRNRTILPRTLGLARCGGRGPCRDATEDTVLFSSPLRGRRPARLTAYAIPLSSCRPPRVAVLPSTGSCQPPASAGWSPPRLTGEAPPRSTSRRLVYGRLASRLLCNGQVQGGFRCLRCNLGGASRALRLCLSANRRLQRTRSCCRSPRASTPSP